MFSPKFDRTTVTFGGDVQRTERLTESLRQQTLKQPLELPLTFPHLPPQRLDPRHHARKLFLQIIGFHKQSFPLSLRQ